MTSLFPPYLRKRHILSGRNRQVERLLSSLNLSTVCQSARCPNRNECFGCGTAAFLLLGEQCTRSCRFCAVKKGLPSPPDPSEPHRVAEAVARMDLRHVVLTSVTRDDLDDGGAHHFMKTILAVRERLPDATIEALVPDFNGSTSSLDTVLSAEPDVLNHNIETVQRLYPVLRPEADYSTSLKLIRYVKERAPDVITKSGMMLGMGEKRSEVIQAITDLWDSRCDVLTLGQYLAPSRAHYPVGEFITPEIFLEYRDIALEMGFRSVSAAPFVRSSYHAADIFQERT